jgi:hypothetical protein
VNALASIRLDARAELFKDATLKHVQMENIASGVRSKQGEARYVENFGMADPAGIFTFRASLAKEVPDCAAAGDCRHYAQAA